MQAENRVSPVTATSQQEYTERIEWTLPHERTRQLILQTAAGNVRVHSGDGERIHVIATRVVCAERAEGAQAFLKQMQINHRQEAERFEIDATWPEPASPAVGSPHVNFEIQVPQGLALQARTGSGSIDATGVGTAHLRTGGGNVICRDLQGHLDVDTTSGSIEVSDSHEAHLRTGGRQHQCSNPARRTGRADGEWQHPG